MCNPVTGFPDPSRQSARVTRTCQSARGRISCHRIALRARLKLIHYGILALVCALASALDARAADQFDKIRALIRNAVDAQNIPSIAVAVAKDGKIVWEEGFGWADREGHIPATEHTLYSLSSISKTFTATGLMALARVGKIDLDKPMNDYLGDAKLTGRGGSASQATVRMVANHSSGLPLHYQFFYADEPYRVPSMDETILHYGILVRPPGEKHVYSNLGYGILGYAISRVTGQSYGDFMREEVFAKLGLYHTSVDIAPGLEKLAATLYGNNGLPLPHYVSDSEGAAAIYSTAHDLVRFGMFHLKAHLPNQATILIDPQIDEMQKTAVAVTKTTGYGIGWGTADTPSGYRIVSHLGNASGVSTDLLLVPSEKIAVAVLCNSQENLPHYVANEILKVLLPKYDGRTSAFAFPPAPDSLGSLTGTWQGKIHTPKADLPFALRFLESGDVHARISNQLKTLLNFVTFRGGELSGQMLGDLGTEDAGRRPYTIGFDLKLRGKVLNGSATAVSRPGSRLWSALSYWVELERQ